MSTTAEQNNVNVYQPKNRYSQSQEVRSRVTYKITPEEMWNCIKGSSQNWGIEGYEIARKYYDYHQVKWYEERKRILDQHKRVWPPQNWPKSKDDENKLVPPKRTTFIDDQIAWANSFNDPKKSDEVKESLESRGTFKYPDPKQYPNLRDKFLKEEQEKKEKMEQIPKVQPWKENAIDAAKTKAEEDKKKIKTQWQKDLEKHPKEKPWWPRADRVTVTSEAEYMGENVPFYYNNSKDDDEDKKNKKLFFPKKDFCLRRAPAWAFQGKNPTKLPTDNMVSRDEAYKDKIENFKSSKNLADKDLLVDVIGSHEKIRRRGRHFFEYKKPYDYANTEQYKLNKEQFPSYSPGPSHYWKVKKNEIDKNERPKETQEETELYGKPSKNYFMNHQRTDFRQYKPMRKSVF